MRDDNGMAALIGFGCGAFFYGAYSSNTDETKSMVHFILGCYVFLVAVLSIKPSTVQQVSVPPININ
jgi:hypothetical protein